MTRTSVKRLVLAIVLLALLLPLAACNRAKRAAEAAIRERDELIALVEDVQYAASNFQLVVDTQYAKVQATTSQADTYYESVIQSGEVWSGNFRVEAEAMAELLDSYRAVDGTTVDPQDLDLSKLQEEGALPGDLASGFMLYVNAIHQAEPPQPDSAVTIGLMDTTNEAMNTIQLAGTDWNDAVREYNTRRSQIKGAIVAEVSEYFGFPLPERFEGYKGGNTGPISNPIGDE